MASQSQDPGGSQNEGKTERVWKLKDCEMSLGSFSKRSPTDAFMTLDLVFCFPDDPVPKIVGELFEHRKPLIFIHGIV